MPLNQRHPQGAGEPVAAREPKDRSAPLKLTFSRDPIGKAIGSPFDRFTSNYAISGLATTKLGRGRLDLLAIVSEEKGIGNFRSFIGAAKTAFAIITVWEIYNKDLEAILARYGFVSLTAMDFNDQPQRVMRWYRPPYS